MRCTQYRGYMYACKVYNVHTDLAVSILKIQTLLWECHDCMCDSKPGNYQTKLRVHAYMYVIL